MFRTNSTLSNPVFISAEEVLSCEGPAEPAYFYINVVFGLAGLIWFGLTLSGWVVALSGQGLDSRHSSICFWGALLPCLAYWMNHREATRVQWSPCLREHFSYPFFILQQCCLLALLRSIRFESSVRIHT